MSVVVPASYGGMIELFVYLLIDTYCTLCTFYTIEWQHAYVFRHICGCSRT